jgi:hypothetical protein
MSRTGIVATLGVLLAPLPASLATAQGLQVPASWRWVTDEPARVSTVTDRVTDSAFTFVAMVPGWHFTMGTGAVLFDPRYFAEGSFALESEVFHFPNSANTEYGFFVGGTSLDGASPRYVSFVLRGDGSVSSWERSGGVTRLLVDWRRAEAVIPNDGKDVVRNVVRLVVTKKEAVLKANGLDVLVLSRENLPLDGQFGFRVGRGVNLHVTTLNVTSRLAPTRD